MAVALLVNLSCCPWSFFKQSIHFRNTKNININNPQIIFSNFNKFTSPVLCSVIAGEIKKKEGLQKAEV